MREHPQRERPSKPTVLLAVVGQSPQVITETLYALVRRDPSARIPRIVAITTAVGAARIRETLADGGWLARFCQDYRMPEPALEVDVAADADGQAVADIHSEEDHIAIADACVRWMRLLTSDDAIRVHASIAGGRKTMSFFLGYAFSLFARDEDEMSHVLVDPAFEGHPEFFYPPPHAREIELADGRRADAAKARVLLAEIPVLKLRARLPDSLFAAEGGYRQTLALADAAQRRPELALDAEQRTLVANGVRVRLAPALFALYCAVIARGQAGRWPGGKLDPIRWEEFAAFYPHSLATGHAERLQEGAFGIGGELDPQRFAEWRSEINKALRAALGSEGARPFEIVKVGEGRFGLAGVNPHMVNLPPRRAVGQDRGR